MRKLGYKFDGNNARIVFTSIIKELLGNKNDASLIILSKLVNHYVDDGHESSNAASQ